MLLGAVTALIGATALVATLTLRLPAGSVVILFTQEIRGHVVPCGCYEGQRGGLAKIPAAAGGLLDDPSALLIDGGDFVGKPAVEGFDDPENAAALPERKRDYLERKHRALVDVLRNLRYDVLAAGEMDFLLGQSFLLSAHQDAGKRILNANIHILVPGGDSRPLFRPFRLFTVGEGSCLGIPFGGVRVGVLGLLSHHARIPYLDRDVYALVVTDPVETARTLVPVIRGRGADVVVVVFHAPWSEGLQLARNVPGLDLVLATHGGVSRPMAEIGSARVAQIPPGGTHLGRVEIDIEGGRAAGASFDAVALEPGLPEDKEVLAPYQAFQQRLEAAPLTPPFLREAPQAFVGSETCRECHDGAKASVHAQWAGTPHARALESLREKGHAGDPECLQCHTTGYGFRTGFGSPGGAGGLGAVGCEACHGPRGRHVEEWKAKKEEGIPLPEVEKRLPVSGWKCLRCHKPSRDPGFEKNSRKRYERIQH